MGSHLGATWFDVPLPRHQPGERVKGEGAVA